MIEVVIADDHRLVRKGIATLLAGTDGIEVIGQAENGKEAVELTDRLSPDVLVLDISMPQMSGIDALNALPPTDRPPVLFLSMHGDRSLVKRALDAGAAGYILKRAAPTELIKGIRQVSAGRRYLSPDLRGKLPAS